MKVSLLLFAFLLNSTAQANPPCGSQDYNLPMEPDYGCLSPGEMENVPNLQPTIAVPAGSILQIKKKNTKVQYDSVLLVKDRAIFLGLRVRHLRKLRYMDTQYLKKILSVNNTYATAMSDLQIKVLGTEAKSWQNKYTSELKKRIQLQEELETQGRWYRNPWFWITLGVSFTTTALMLK